MNYFVLRFHDGQLSYCIVPRLVPYACMLISTYFILLVRNISST